MCNNEDMATRTFDTYKAVKDLEQVGIDEDVARVMVGMVGDAMTENVATKADLENLRLEIKADMQALESRMTVRFVWMSLGIVGLTSTIMGVLLQLQ